MSEKEENGEVDPSVQLLNGEKRVSLSGDLARKTRNNETTKRLTIVEKESKYT